MCIRDRSEAPLCGGLRNRLFAVPRPFHPLWNGVFRECRQCICPWKALSHLYRGVFCGDFLPVPVHHPDGARVSESKQSVDLSADRVPDGGNHRDVYKRQVMLIVVVMMVAALIVVIIIIIVVVLGHHRRPVSYTHLR